MASSAPQPAAEFYEWALKRYQRRAAVLTRVLLAITLIALLLSGLFMVQVRELETQNISQNHSTRAEVERLHERIVEMETVAERRHQRTLAYTTCLESQTRRYQDGMSRLLRRNITLKVFLKNYKLKDCK